MGGNFVYRQASVPNKLQLDLTLFAQEEMYVICYVELF